MWLVMRTPLLALLLAGAFSVAATGTKGTDSLSGASAADSSAPPLRFREPLAQTHQGTSDQAEGNFDSDLIGEDSFPPQVILPPPPPQNDFRLVEREGVWRALPVHSHENYWSENHRPDATPLRPQSHHPNYHQQGSRPFAFSPQDGETLYEVNHHYRPLENEPTIDHERRTKPTFDFGPPPSGGRNKIDRHIYNPYIVDNIPSFHGRPSHSEALPRPPPQAEQAWATEDRAQNDYDNSPSANPRPDPNSHRFQQPGSLASLLSDAAVLRSPQPSVPVDAPFKTGKNDGQSDHSIHESYPDEHNMEHPPKYADYHQPNDEFIPADYYDSLYDEFLDMYYDSDLSAKRQSNGNEEEKKKQDATSSISLNVSHGSSNSSGTLEIDKGRTSISTPIPPTTLSMESESVSAKTIVESRTVKGIEQNDPSGPQVEDVEPFSLISTSTTDSIKRFSSTPFETTTLSTAFVETSPTPTLSKPFQKAKDEENSNSPGGGQPFSLSELLQKIGMGLPTFLKSLKEHDLTLREFTELLQGKKLGKRDFQRIQSSVGNLLVLLREKERSRSIMQENDTPKSTKETTPAVTTTSSSTTTTTTTTTTTATTTTTNRSILPNETKQDKATSSLQPPSLSEVLEKIGMKLPTFLASLQEHDLSLKAFTELLNENHLRSEDFKLINSDVGNLLTLLRKRSNAEDPTLRKSTDASQPEPRVIDSPLIVVSITESSNQMPPTTIKSIETETAESSANTQASPTPLIFGSRPASLDFDKKATLNQGSQDDRNTTKIRGNGNKVTLKLDIISLMKEKNLTAEEILHDFKTIFNISLPGKDSPAKKDKNKTPKPAKNENADRISGRYKGRHKKEKDSAPRPYRPLGYEGGWGSGGGRGIVNNRLSSTARPTIRPYTRRPYTPSNNTEVETSTAKDRTKLFNKRKYYEELLESRSRAAVNPDDMNIATKSAIMAAGILGAVALSVFIAIFVVVKYKNYMHRRKRRTPISMTSDSSTSSMPPLYASRNSVCRSSQRTNGFWNSLKRKFDPYSLSSTTISM